MVVMLCIFRCCLLIACCRLLCVVCCLLCVVLCVDCCLLRVVWFCAVFVDCSLPLIVRSVLFVDCRAMFVACCVNGL